MLLWTQNHFFLVCVYSWIWVRRCLNSDWPAHMETWFLCMCKCVCFTRLAWLSNVWPLLSCSWRTHTQTHTHSSYSVVFSPDSGLIAAWEIAREIAIWLIAVVCDLYSRCNSPTPQGLHTSAIVTVTYWSPSPWQHHQGGLSLCFLLPAEEIFFPPFYISFEKSAFSSVNIEYTFVFLEHLSHIQRFILPSNHITEDYSQKPLL